MPIRHHAGADTLMSFASGTLGEALGAVVASHLSLCPHCRAELAHMNEIGGTLLKSLPGSAMTAARATGVQPAAPTRAQPPTAATTGAAPRRPVPAPIARLAGRDLDAVAWKRLAPGIWHMRLPLSRGATGDLRLIKIAPGQTMPDHGHSGTELTLVLDGSYSDAVGRFGEGDLADLDGAIEHQPVSDPQTGCICLIASEKPARFKSLFARLVQPFTGL